MLAAIEITKPDDIHHLIKWNDEVIGPTLDFARKHLHIHDGLLLRRIISAPDSPATARINSGGKPVELDHLIALDGYPIANLVIGLGRPSSKLHRRKLADYPKHANKNIWPLRQLANLCMMAKTRYGYITTEEELMVCCFSRDGPKLWKVAVRPIPWSRHGENQLTTDLALWWLCMLAISSRRNRAIVREEEMIGIDQWETRYIDDERGLVRRHVYSKFEEPIGPRAPPACQDPWPSDVAANAAAFAAGVGINADQSANLDTATSANSDDFDFNTLLDPVTANLEEFNLNTANLE
ncbi:hypothetical protein F4677DRAFT_402390 [Hypoxylon crocopeplum]|nr:hypothetical protein F4677DRAFT_402390 [Hypoxylon crocopeplum]